MTAVINTAKKYVESPKVGIDGNGHMIKSNVDDSMKVIPDHAEGNSNVHD